MRSWGRGLAGESAGVAPEAEGRMIWGLGTALMACWVRAVIMMGVISPPGKVGSAARDPAL